MAEKKASVTYEQLMRDLQARKFSPIYILMGEESFYIDKISDYIAENVLQPEERDFNQTVLFGADTSAAQVVDLAREYPMMAQNRVVIIKEAQALRSTEALEKYFEKPVSSTILVLCHKNGTIDRRKKIIDRAQIHGVVFESKKLNERELPGFIDTYLKRKNATVDRKAAEMIAEHVGADLNRLTSELDKVLLSLPEHERRVSPEVVEEQIGISKDFNAFELKSAIIKRDVYKANLIIKYFNSNPKSGSVHSVIPLLFNFFQNLMVAYYAPNKTNENDVAKFLDLRSGWAARDYIMGMRNYSGMKTMQIISKIREIDAKSKGLDNPNTEGGELLKELIYFILH